MDLWVPHIHVVACVYSHHTHTSHTNNKIESEILIGVGRVLDSVPSFAKALKHEITLAVANLFDEVLLLLLGILFPFHCLLFCLVRYAPNLDHILIFIPLSTLLYLTVFLVMCMVFFSCLL